MQHINHLRSVVALAKHGHFGRAAESIGLTQSALSQNIQRVEAIYGVALFTRQQGRVAPTGYGEVAIASAEAALEALEQAERGIHLLQNLETGHLVIGVDPYLASSVLAPALSSLLEAYPSLKFTLHTSDWVDLEKSLLSDEIDLLFGLPPKHPRPDIKQTAITVPTPLILCAKTHVLRDEESISLAQAVEFPIVCPEPPEWYIDWAKLQIEEYSDRESVTEPYILTTDNLAVAKQVVKKGRALMAAMRPDVEHELRSGELVILNLLNWPATMNCCIATRTNRMVSPAAQKLSEFFARSAAAEIEKTKEGSFKGAQIDG
jgi:DNA-binding transcriptional LysR family regulator